MIKPVININGSSKDDLSGPRLDAMDRIAEAIEELKKVTPNGRDYPGDNDQCLADRQTHYRRIKALQDLYIELYDETIAIRRQGQ